MLKQTVVSTCGEAAVIHPLPTCVYEVAQSYTLFLLPSPSSMVTVPFLITESS